MHQNPILLDRSGLRKCGIRLANSTLLRLEAKGAFVRRIRIGATVYWPQKEVEAFLARLTEDAGR
jgi:predicted DNA-binding transcriptional regulator AlpA